MLPDGRTEHADVLGKHGCEHEKQEERTRAVNLHLTQRCDQSLPLPPKIGTAAPVEAERKWPEERLEEEIHRKADDPVQPSPIAQPAI